MRASELAATYEVSTRTIYRDIGALSEAGVPVILLPGKGYALSEGFFLPPLIFTPGEAAAIALGTRMLASQATGRHVSEAERALEKIATVLPADVRHQVDRLNEIITIVQPPGRFHLDDPRLARLQEAILNRCVIAISYRSRYDEEITEREVEPLELTYFDRSWYLRAHCRLREDMRTFRVSRMTAVTISNERFEPRSFERQEPRSVEVVVRFADSVAPWVRERQHWAFQHEEQEADGVVMTYRPSELRETSSWILPGAPTPNPFPRPSCGT